MSNPAKEFQAWRKRVRKGLPVLAGRVFALRGVLYPGCGFHWCMERGLGQVVALTNDYDRSFNEFDIIGVEIAVEELYRSVARAEAGI